MAHWAQLQGKGKAKKQTAPLADELRMCEKEWCESWHTVPLAEPQPGKWISMREKKQEEAKIRVKKENDIY